MLRRPPISTLFPYTRSSDLHLFAPIRGCYESEMLAPRFYPMKPGCQDRKSTRLNSSHVAIAYAVFCLKKKTVGFRSVLHFDYGGTYFVLFQRHQFPC